MGMFDYLTCDLPLPHFGLHPEWGFQTKSLQCTLDAAHISRSGRLIFRHALLEYIPEDERHPSGLPFMRTEGYEFEDLDYHGWLGFHGGPTDRFYSFEAKFTDGLCVEIHLREVEFCVPPDRTLETVRLFNW